MSQPYVGEIRMFAGTFAPVGWTLCNGQLLSIADNDVLFQLIGTTYGGDGQTTFGVPDFRGRVPIHFGSGPGLTARQPGEMGGVEAVTLTSNQLPSHTHQVQATTNQGNVSTPGPNVILARPYDPIAPTSLYVTSGTSTLIPAAMPASAISNVGGGQPHSNLMPTLTLNFIISLFGIFPSQF